MSTVLRAIVAFLFFFRPAIFHPSLPGTIIILPLAFWGLGCKRKSALFPITSLGLVFNLSLIFILIWSLTIDLVSGGLFSAGLRSQFATALRFVLYIFIAYSFVFHLCPDASAVRRAVIHAVVIQIAIAVIMLVSSSAKIFFYKSLSGYSGAEKVFRDHFFSVRIFGWSEELFFTAPVFIVLAVLVFGPFRSFYRYPAFAVTSLIALMNARVALVSFALLGVRFKDVLFSIIFCMFLIMIVALGLSPIGGRAGDIVAYIAADFSSGGSRTVQILLNDQLVFPDNIVGWVLGNGLYFYGAAAESTSDIGYVIVLQFGGVLYLLAWVFLFLSLIFRAVFGWGVRVLLVLIFLALAFKGLVFSGNAFTAFLLVLAFYGKRFGAASCWK